ncbi:MAG: HD domain-containing protein [Lachnospiraceae bacterium]|nr:HD domain-containing protein [Lachnospiraceae bacterium]
MIFLFYGGMFIASLICTAIYIYMWHRHFDVNLTMIFTLVPITCLGYALYALSENLREAVLANKIVYIGGCFLQLFVLFCILHLCQIQLKRWLRMTLFLACALIYGCVLTVGYTQTFYKSVTYETTENYFFLVKEYGPMHTVFYGMVVLFFLAGLFAIVYSYLAKSQIPRVVLYLLVLPDVICMASFFGGRRIIQYVDFLPLGYVLAQITFLMIAYRVNLYNISDTVIDSMVREQQIGYVSFDFKYRYLGSNDVAKKIMPELETKAVDEMFGYREAERKIRHFLDSFQTSEANNTFAHTVKGDSGDPEDERIYAVKVGYLYDGAHKRGFIITFTDDTANRKYIRLLDGYNEKLQQEVEEKTRHIVDMHDNLIMSLAMMVESRDNSTGGHIKRTSDGIRILMDEIMKEEKYDFSMEFCKNIIKAAPMHDLGKIAVDDAVLRKPGKFTDEEYEKMKLHAAEGARVIHEILRNTDDEAFKTVAENVAHYHHERWDGSGYPEGLSGEQIPIEARIMAIADVYDALVSKRVYKEAFDFEKANRIILEGMGTQFDPNLQSAYEKARPRLEAYYGKC